MLAWLPIAALAAGRAAPRPTGIPLSAGSPSVVHSPLCASRCSTHLGWGHFVSAEGKCTIAK